MWLYWFRRLVDSRSAIVIRGTVPEMHEIERLPGKIAIGPWDSNSRTPKFLEDARAAERA